MELDETGVGKQQAMSPLRMSVYQLTIQGRHRNVVRRKTKAHKHFTDE